MQYAGFATLNGTGDGGNYTWVLPRNREQNRTKQSKGHRAEKAPKCSQPPLSDWIKLEDFPFMKASKDTKKGD